MLHAMVCQGRQIPKLLIPTTDTHMNVKCVERHITVAFLFGGENGIYSSAVDSDYERIQNGT